MQLLTRLFLLVVFSVTYLYPQPNLLLLVVTATMLLFYIGWKKVYSKDSVWMLEGISLSNLIFLSGGLLSCADIQKVVVVYISLSIAFVQFIVIMAYHIATCCCKKHRNAISHLDGQSALSLGTAGRPALTDEGTRSSTSVTSKEQAEGKGFRDSVLLLASESEPLLSDHGTQRWKYFDCCKKRSNSVNNLNYS